MLIYENLDANNAISNRREAKELIHFVVWSLTDGQELSEMLGFARLPEPAVEKSIQMIRQLKWNGELIGQEVLVEQGLLSST